MKVPSLVSLLLLGASAAKAELFWVCPSSERTFPANEDVHFSAPANPKCVDFIAPIGVLPMFVWHEEPLALPEGIQLFPLDFFPDFSVLFAPEESLQELEPYLIRTSKQPILRSRPAPEFPMAKRLPSFLRTADKDQVIADLNGSLFLDEMEKISGEKPFVVNGKSYKIATRNTFTQSNKDAAAYFHQRFRELGYDALYQEFRVSNQPTQNIIGVKRGTSLADEIVVVGAHMDSTSPDVNNAPGCIDNGSGSEASFFFPFPPPPSPSPNPGVMEMARVFANVTTSRTIHFVLFGGEEQGLHGSNYYVNNRGSNRYNVVYSLVMDMIGYSNRYFGVKLETSSSSANKQLADLAQSNLQKYSSDLTVVRSTNYFGSDHVPFINSGIPCFLAIEQDDTTYPGYHRTTDRVNYLSVEQSMGIINGLAGTLYDVSV